MKKILLFLVLPLFVFGAVDVSQIAKIQNDSLDIKEKQVVNYDSNNSDLNQTQFSVIKVFGAHLFSGNFTKFTQHVYNPDYKLTVGDRINVKIWGAVEFIQTLTVDSQGNIFIPKVGAINLLGVKNSALVSVITKAINKIYKSNVYVYADMDIYQNVSVFVTGNVNQPGLYQGLSSDSIIQYIDKAKGINLEYGSFREIEILRDNQVIKKIDLYDFLLKGELGLFPFRMGDVILVGSVKDYVFVNGDVQKPFRFELSQDIKTLADIANIAGAKPIVTNAVVKSYRADHRLQIDAYAKKDFSEVILHAGDEIEFRPDYTAQNINIQIEGEHSGLHSIVVKKGTTLADVVDMISANPQSNMQALQIFRKSVAATQKQLINAQLKELETLALTSSSVNAEQASIRATQAKTILDFIERAKKVEPKGQIVIDSVKAYKAVVLEDGDIINIPSKNNIVLVQGEVSIPGAFVYINKEKLRYYINLAGGYSDRADVSRVLIINANGKATKYNGRSSADVKPGDSVLVLPKVDSQNLQVVSMLTQILYQIAIATNVVLNL
ncbi:capsular polysaccharide export system, periplasmic protein [Campylobacter insulaenigrae]|uniref:Capsular polysaccharide export system, periplasmic protein n=1 Tax=Campylobacter insulaenigrae NCTC 12927 TaxID=1031564 RepID=A0A0A8H2Z5_9BACT|nr:capsular polysaccharide export system, periplasmic protein [Campylobacter insulaenigrae]AJC87284.1 capsular polysaccharide export system, periplasmic protein [Campylobacter insulaenigrae NCTC 12927]VEH93123.1 capsular polysaccharide ABC transporter, periplasmic polysaccharide-binding protein [Campylobacter insulaenigrae]